MAKNVPSEKLANEFGYILEVLAKRSESEVDRFLSVFTEARAKFETASEDNGKPVLTIAVPEGYTAFAETKLTEDEAKQVADLETEIAEAKAEAEAASIAEAEDVWKANKAEADKAKTGVEYQAIRTRQDVALVKAQMKAARPHNETAFLKAEEKTVLEGKKTEQGKKTFKEKVSGSSRTVHKKLTIPFIGIWRAKGTRTRGETVYHVAKNALYHMGMQQEKLTFLGNCDLDSATALQRWHNAITDDENAKVAVPYTSKPEDQKEAFTVVKDIMEAAKRLEDLAQYKWKDVGGSALCAHVTYDPQDPKYDIDATTWLATVKSVPKPIKDQLELSRPEAEAEAVS